MLTYLSLASVCSASISLPTSNAYPYGIKSLATDQNSANAMLLREWEDWKSSRITTSGAGGYRRVQTSGSQEFTTCSEGMGYGMLLSVYFNERDLFDDLYSYAKKYFNGTGLMDWSIDANGKVASTGAATDGDEDMATALVFAHKRWGSSGTINYEQEAKNYINNLFKYCVEPGTYVLKPGNWGGSDALNPCYFVPSWYRIYADFTGNKDWLKVADKCYEVLDQIEKFNNKTGLVPDWCKADGTEQRLAVWNGTSKYEYSYDAARMPWRIALDYSWYGTEKAKVYCDKVSAFFKNIGPENIVDGYSLTGQKIGQYHNPAFVATAGAGCLTGEDLDFGQKMFNESVKVKDSAPYDYYGNTLRMLTLLYMSGNFPNLYNGSLSPTITPTATATVITPTPTSNKYVVGDLNGDNSFNSIDFGYLRMYILGMINSFPSEYGMLAADVDGNGQINSLDFGFMRQVLVGMRSELPKKN
ncbi:glycosyl hydrolase family 8 [Acetivibrio cellulolyticus]|uniref:glycosyl hydrolase family 8 n=1 Tax=Acetivibrio cellulolyticus TaxID=35830 RepID=UPI000E3CA855|nr:glycosyl hydrolase family 8 [Acetivibrio cellulolyticus]